MKLFKFYIFAIIVTCIYACKSSKEIIFDSTHLVPNNWIIEQQPEGKVRFINNTLEIIDANGCTIWFKHKLQSPIKISFDATVIDNGEAYDRVSDLNCFWMANDPKNPEDFFKESEIRQGLFKNYHELNLYYVGYGGHNNTKTRFRRYNGDMDRPLLPEYDLSGKNFMIVPNKKLQITIIVNNKMVSYARDNEIIFELIDQKPYLSGYFGIRTVNNHMKIENLIITQL